MSRSWPSKYPVSGGSNAVLDGVDQLTRLFIDAVSFKDP